jgi:tRNA pseudouridine55 synthase
MNGVIVVDKPRGWTSHDVVNRMRRIAGTKKVGHLGTLDPLATGVLPLLIERATRLAQYFGANEKIYEATVRFGLATTTYDAEGTPTSEPREVVLTAEDVERALAPFRGTFMQTPPPVSAKKIQGRPAHELVRKNIEFELKPVEVTVHAMELLGFEGADLRVRVHCGAGTYVRSIAHDAGQLLGCGAHLTELRRTASGPFSIAQARSLEDLAALGEAGRLKEALIPAAELLPEFVLEIVDRLTEAQIRQGRDFRVSPFRVRDAATKVKAVSEDGELVAIGEARLPNIYHPVLVL